MTRDSYFPIHIEVFTNHILAANMYFRNHREWTEHKNIILNSANKYKVI